MKKRMRLRLTGTGTSQGIPVIGSTHPVCLSDDPRDKRLRTAAIVIKGDTLIAIDCGPDFRQQMLTARAQQLTALLITHEHSDHTAGLDDIRPFYFRGGKKPIEVYATERVHKNLAKRFDYIWNPDYDYPGVPNVRQNQIADSKFWIDDICITPVVADHGMMPVTGFVFDDGTRRLGYLTDCKTIEEDQLQLLNNLDVLVLNCLRDEPHYSHLNRAEAINLVDKVKPNETYLTHMSHEFGFHAQTDASLPDNIHLGYDTLEL